MNLNELKDVFNFLKAKKIVSNQNDFAKRLDYSRQYVSEVLNGTRVLTDDFIGMVNGVFWNEIREWKKMVEFLKIEDVYANKESDRVLIPLYDTVATAGQKNADMSPITEPVDHIDAGDWFRDATAAMRVHGESMMPEYHSGSIVALKEIHDKQQVLWGQDYVFETDEYRAIKRLQKGKNERYILACSANEERWDDGSEKGRLVHEPFEIEVKKIGRLFIVLGSVRRKHSSRIVYNKSK